MVEKIVEAKLSRSEQPLLFLRTHIAQYKLVQGDLPGTKALIEAGKESLDSLPDVRCLSSLRLVPVWAFRQDMERRMQASFRPPHRACAQLL